MYMNAYIYIIYIYISILFYNGTVMNNYITIIIDYISIQDVRKWYIHGI